MNEKPRNELTRLKEGEGPREAEFGGWKGWLGVERAERNAIWKACDGRLPLTVVQLICEMFGSKAFVGRDVPGRISPFTVTFKSFYKRRSWLKFRPVKHSDRGAFVTQYTNCPEGAKLADSAVKAGCQGYLIGDKYHPGFLILRVDDAEAHDKDCNLSKNVMTYTDICSSIKSHRGPVKITFGTFPQYYEIINSGRTIIKHEGKAVTACLPDPDIRSWGVQTWRLRFQDVSDVMINVFSGRASYGYGGRPFREDAAIWWGPDAKEEQWIDWGKTFKTDVLDNIAENGGIIQITIDFEKKTVTFKSESDGEIFAEKPRHMIEPNSFEKSPSPMRIHLRFGKGSKGSVTLLKCANDEEEHKAPDPELEPPATNMTLREDEQLAIQLQEAEYAHDVAPEDPLDEVDGGTPAWKLALLKAQEKAAIARRDQGIFLPAEDEVEDTRISDQFKAFDLQEARLPVS